MRSKNKALAIGYIILLILLILSLFFEYAFHLVREGSEGHGTYIVLGFSFFLYGGEIGLVLLGISILLIFKENRKAPLPGFIGCGLIFLSMVLLFLTMISGSTFIIINNELDVSTIDRLRAEGGGGIFFNQIFYGVIGIVVLIILVNLVSIFTLKPKKPKKLKRKKCRLCRNMIPKDQFYVCHECSKKSCKNCYNSNRNLCSTCNTKFEMKKQLTPQQQQSQQVIVQQVAPQVETKHCIHCGAEIKKVAKFCDACGKEQ